MRQDARMLKPFIRVRPLALLQFNTNHTKVRRKAGHGVGNPANNKTGVNKRRINKETQRQALARACFVSVPLLVKSDSKRTVPTALRSK